VGEDSQIELQRRADGLRDCARRARWIAQTLGPYLDSEVERAEQRDPAIWQGPYADSTTATLSERKRTLNDMAEALVADADRWAAEATALEERARQDGGDT
jgi:hypothetical protein